MSLREPKIESTRLNEHNYGGLSGAVKLQKFNRYEFHDLFQRSMLAARTLVHTEEPVWTL